MRNPIAPILVCFLALVSSAHAQSLLYCPYGDDFFPVASVKAGIPMCFTGDSLVKGNQKELVQAPTKEFGEGFVHVEIVKNKRDGVVSDNGVLSFASTRSWYLLVCRLTPDRDMNDCYVSINFDSYGDKSIYIRSLGELKEGEPKTLRVYMKLKYEMPEQVHVFSGMEEMRTTLIPEAYQYEQGSFAFASK